MAAVSVLLLVEEEAAESTEQLWVYFINNEFQLKFYQWERVDS